MAVQGPRDVDRWAELGRHRMDCALLEHGLRTGPPDMARQRTPRATKRNLVRWTGRFPQ